MRPFLVETSILSAYEIMHAVAADDGDSDTRIYTNPSSSPAIPLPGELFLSSLFAWTPIFPQ